MKLKIVILDLELPPRVRSWALRIGIPLLLLFGAAAAFAAPLHVWKQGDVLNADDLNQAFANLQAQVQALTPAQGRLVLSAGSCTGASSVQSADVPSASTICYVPHTGNLLPIDGTTYTFSTLDLELSASHQSAGNVYDVFAVAAAGSAALCIDGKAWATASSRADEIAPQPNGRYANATPLASCYNGDTDLGAVGAAAGLYLGSVYMTGDGVTAMARYPAQADGGSNNVLGLYNAYNQVMTTAYERDATPMWTYATVAWRPANGSTANRVTFVDGLGRSPVSANYTNTMSSAISGLSGATVSFCVNCTTPGLVAQINNQTAFDGPNQGTTVSAFGEYYGTLGVSYVQAIESGGGGDTVYYGNTFGGLIVSLPM